MGKALYRKYRSKSLVEIIGQEHITETLSNSLKQGTISHAYLFTGPRGTGKTSIARILAHQVNGLDYNEEQSHLDIIEIDAASNRRIDEIRELTERVFTAPTSAKYKVYIIDEVHMLTKEAFNALLKTLEEPPAHAIFILATTEVHKVPDTIISRTQRFTFKPVPASKVITHLQYIAHQEKIQIDDDALGLIADHGQGSFRDSIGLLDQVRHLEAHITVDHVRQALGQAPEIMLTKLLEVLSTGHLDLVAQQLSQLKDQGVQPAQVAHQLSMLLRGDILQPVSILPKDLILTLLQQLAAVPAARDPAVNLELALYGATLITAPQTSLPSPSIPTVPLPADQLEAKNQTSDLIVEAFRPVKPKEITTEPQTTKSLKPDITTLPMPAATPANELMSSKDVDDDEIWQKILSSVKAHHNTLYGITRMAVPTFETGKLTLTFAFAFHQKKLKDSKNHQALLRIVQAVTGQSVEIDCVTGPVKKPAPSPVKLTKPSSIDLENISNIFGAAEVVE